jgi:hypothetical protein
MTRFAYSDVSDHVAVFMLSAAAELPTQPGSEAAIRLSDDTWAVATFSPCPDTCAAEDVNAT